MPHCHSIVPTALVTILAIYALTTQFDLYLPWIRKVVCLYKTIVANSTVVRKLRVLREKAGLSLASSAAEIWFCLAVSDSEYLWQLPSSILEIVHL